MRRISLLIPDLFSPDVVVTKEYLPELPAMNRLLTRSQMENSDSASFLASLQNIFSLEDHNRINAAVSHMADDMPPHDGFWMRADPIHLQADQKGLFLFDSRGFAITRQEALALVAEIRPVLLDLGAEIQVPAPERWYLRFAIEPDITTTPVYDVLGKDIQQYLPKGNDASKWAKVINEIQMVLHESEINQQREARGELAINSLWCWGEGSLLEASNSKFTRIYTNDALVKGFAKHNATVCSDLVKRANEVDFMEQHINILCVLDEGISFRAYHDLEGWLEWLQQLEADWFQPLMQKVKNNTLDELILYSNTYQFTYNIWSTYYFWRKNKTPASFQDL